MSGEEAFLIASRRLGIPDALSGSFLVTAVPCGATVCCGCSLGYAVSTRRVQFFSTSRSSCRFSCLAIGM